MKQLLVVAVVALVVATRAQDTPPDTVDELDATKYVGRWYQMFANFLVNVTFERDAFCVTADYGIINATYLSVLNANAQGAPDGSIQQISGYAFIPDPSEPGQLDVYLEAGVPGEYWILLLGPDTSSGLYAYSVVSTSTRNALFVLARDVNEFRDFYQDEVLAWLANNGFDGPYREPLETYQASDCEYLPEE